MDMDQAIEIKRKELVQLTKIHMLSDPQIVKVSQELDKLIYQSQTTKSGVTS